MPPETVVAVCSLVIRPLLANQQARGTQQDEQPVTPECDARLRRFRREQVVQLARTQARLAQAHVPHQRGDLLDLGAAGALARAALVVRLAADADVSAGPLDTQPLDSTVERPWIAYRCCACL